MNGCLFFLLQLSLLAKLTFCVKNKVKGFGVNQWREQTQLIIFWSIDYWVLFTFWIVLSTAALTVAVGGSSTSMTSALIRWNAPRSRPMTTVRMALTGNNLIYIFSFFFKPMTYQTNNSYHSPKSIHGPPQCITNASGWRFFRITWWCMNRTTFYKKPHEYDKCNTHQQNCPPKFLKKISQQWLSQ